MHFSTTRGHMHVGIVARSGCRAVHLATELDHGEVVEQLDVLSWGMSITGFKDIVDMRLHRSAGGGLSVTLGFLMRSGALSRREIILEATFGTGELENRTMGILGGRIIYYQGES